jgi:hypothetical protein
MRLMPADKVHVDERLWATASKTRRHEWRVLCEDLAKHPALLPGKTATAVVIGVDETHVEVTVLAARDAADGPAPERETLRRARAALDAVLSEYLDVIRRLDDDGISSMRAEALDMAKKVVHDDAAKRVAALYPELAEDHEVRRRFFSLFVALAVDTTRLAHAHRHR